MKLFIKTFLLFIFISLFTGCATVQNYQTTCEQKFSYFPDMVTCLINTTNWDYRYRFGRKSDLGQAYLAYADKLAVLVRDNQISNAQAYDMLAQAYIQLNTTQWYRTSTYTVR